MNAFITYPFDEKLLKLFAAEQKSFERASYTIDRRGNELVFSINAKDATSLRACMTTITKILSLWETTAPHGSA